MREGKPRNADADPRPHPMKTLLRLVLLAALAARGVAQSSQTWSQGDPTPQEQAALEWLNAARNNPVGTLTRILNQADADPVIGGFMLAEKPITADQLEQQLATIYRIAQANSAQFPNSSAISGAPLTFYPLFQEQARTLGPRTVAPATNFPGLRPPPTYIYPVPFFGGALLSGPGNILTGPDATGGTARFGPFGANYTELSHANLYAPYLGGREWVLSMLVAPGSGSPPPSFLSQGDALPGLVLGHTRMVGLALSPGQGGGQILTLYKGSNEFFTTSDLPFGPTGTVFLTGVAYRDANSNGFYDAGEGISGVRISLNRSPWNAVTSTSGGFAIPVATGSGSYMLTAEGGPFAGATASATVGTDNVKVDWVLPAAATVLPPQVMVAPSDGPTQLIALSTRGLIQTGANVLIGGIVIGGPANIQKRLLIRGVGPSLQTVGFPAAECIPATSIQVFRDSTVLAGNTGWTTNPDGGLAVAQAAAAVGDFPLVNWAGGGGDSALIMSLPPGAYTVIVSPAPGLPEVYLTGRVGLVEIYDLSPNDGGRFVDISTRGLAGAGSSQLIVGCSIAGSGHKRLLLRGVGPTLGVKFGVPGTLPNPQITLFDGASRPIASNDDWNNSDQTTQIRDLAAIAGAFPLPEEGPDASLLTLAAAGNYTAIVGARAGTTASGVALVELYEAP
jgi:hypothetical protein